MALPPPARPHHRTVLVHSGTSIHHRLLAPTAARCSAPTLPSIAARSPPTLHRIAPPRAPATTIHCRCLPHGRALLCSALHLYCYFDSSKSMLGLAFMGTRFEASSAFDLRLFSWLLISWGGATMRGDAGGGVRRAVARGLRA